MAAEHEAGRCRLSTLRGASGHTAARPTKVTQCVRASHEQHEAGACEGEGLSHVRARSRNVPGLGSTPGHSGYRLAASTLEIRTPEHSGALRVSGLSSSDGGSIPPASTA